MGSDTPVLDTRSRAVELLQKLSLREKIGQLVQVNGDQWGEEYYTTRYQETMERIAHTKKEIRKNLDLAKYIKL